VARLLVHIVTGPENPTRAALGMLVARTALQSGHDVDVFFAGDGVGLLRAATLDAGMGIGTGSLREHQNALVEGGARLYASGMSAKARGIIADDFEGAPVAFSTPDTLVELVFAAERVLVY
jgi:uncharacterized protein